MTDNLRTRIAAITARLIREEIDIDPVWLVAEHVADAVIREMGLRQERKRHTHPSQYRYVTEWETDSGSS